jgi:hypothetical protein
MGHTRPFPMAAAHPVKNRRRFEGPRCHMKLKTSVMVAIGVGVFFFLPLFSSTGREDSFVALMALLPTGVFVLYSYMLVFHQNVKCVGGKFETLDKNTTFRVV